MLKIGLTGSIAVGKSYVCQILRELGCPSLDADQTARDVVKPGTKGLQSITENFGAEFLTADGELDRLKLGAVVFADEPKLQLLNSIVHPLVIERQNEWLARIEQENPQGIAVIDAALLIESGGWKRFDKIIVVWCVPEIQIERLMRRGDFTRDEAVLRIGAQMPQSEKKKYADFTIDTSAGFEETRARTIKVFEQLNRLTQIS